MLLAQADVAVRAFEETALSHGLAVAVLISIVAGLLFIQWKVSSRLADSQIDRDKRMADAIEKSADAVTELKISLQTICRADCPSDCDNYRPNKRKTG